jgi:hypothetical protein
VGVMSRDLISQDSNRGMASRAADSRWDRGILTKWAANRERKRRSFCWARVSEKANVGGWRGGCAGQEFDKKLWSRKEEPAGNLKGKFAGWIALVGVLFSPSLGWLAGFQLPLPPHINWPAPSSLPFRPFLTGCLSLSRLHTMDSPQDTPSTDHHDDQQAKSS